MTSKTIFALGTAAAALMAAPAWAQAPAPAPATEENTSGLAEIVVTAQKRVENLQDTPIAISVLSSEGIKQRNVQSLLDLGDGAIPSLKVAPFFSRPGALIINIRGVGVLSDSNQPARDQGVGVYVDGVYLGRAQGLGTALYDVENIEVLKGPQGTLFGRNTEGGAVSIVTKRPSGEFKLDATFGYGNYGAYKAVVHLDLPEANNISLKFDGILTKRDGMVKNPYGQGSLDYNSFDKRGFRAEAQWKPSPNFTANFAFDIAYDATSTLYFQQLTRGTGLTTAQTGTANPALPNAVAAIYTLEPTRASVAAVGGPQQASVGNTNGVRLGLDWEVTSALRLRSITSYRNLQQTQFDNASAATSVQQAATVANPNPSFLNFPFARYSIAPFRQNQFSQEVQAIGEFSRVKYQFGALYYQENVEDSAQAPNTLQFLDAAGATFGACNAVLIASCRPIVQRASHVTTTSIGAYGQATINPAFAGEIFSLTLGGRYTRDKKVGSLFTINGALPTIPVNGVNVTGAIPFSRAWSRIDPLINLAVKPSEDVLIYGKWSTGYKSGGASSRSLSYRGFDPETVSMFEVGAKLEFLDNKARFNVAAYTGTYKSIQLDFAGLYEDVINGVRVATTRTTLDVVNAPGTGRLKGVEAELTLAPTRGLQLSGAFAYNSVKIPDTLNPFPQPNNNGQAFTVPLPIYQVYTPEYSANAAIDYTAEFDDFSAKFHIDGNYDSGYFANYTDSNYNSATRAVVFQQPKGDPALIFNARVSLADFELGQSGAKLGVAIWARNLFNEQHVFYKSGSATAGLSGFFNDFRTFGFELNIKM
jgi:iron complex outermembrane recepter protein